MLQWGHADVGVEDAAMSRQRMPVAMLQWGHADVGVEDADLDRAARRRPSFNGATPMSAWKTPRSTHRRRARTPCFNGATPMSAWKTAGMRWSPDRPIQLQWGHADVGVEDADADAGRIADERSFNGATPMSAWKTRTRRDGRIAQCGFNGATPMSAWKTPRLTGRSPRDACFNGATPMSAWKTAEFAAANADHATLQWGHADVGVEDQAVGARSQ